MAEGRRGWMGWVFAVIGAWVWYLSAFGELEAGKVFIDHVAARASNGEDRRARFALRRLSEGMARCGTARGGTLPSSATPVPDQLSSVRGKQYQSAADDWHDEAYKCAGFSLTEPQSFQFSWALSSATEGVATAQAARINIADEQQRMEVTVTCRGGTCEAGPQPVRTTPLERFLDARTGRTSLYPWDHLAVLFGMGWLLYEAFVVSVGWGVALVFVPFTSVVFAWKHWWEARRPALVLWVSSAVSAFALLASPAPPSGRSAARGKTDRAAVAAVASSLPVTSPSPEVVVPPVPSVGPLPAFDGTVVDLSSVMGRARKLANEWQADATLLGIEATAQSGKIQPQLGGKAKLTFGPSPFGAETNPKRTGLFVVTYDQTGIHGAPQPGKPGVALPEPMCSPEAVLLRVSDWGTGALQLRYGVDPAARPSWLVSPAGDPKQLRIFEPQACAPRGIQVGRPR